MEPTQPGQICQIIRPISGENSEDVYIIAEDPQSFSGEETIQVVNLKELQRNINNPQMAKRISVAKEGLDVIADSLDLYIKSWNKS